MSREIKISIGAVELPARLNETETAAKVWRVLPITASVNLWGEEIYFPVPVETGPEKAQETVALGDIAYWPQGKAMCLFFGRTPVSRGEEIRPISPVNVIGRIEGDAALLKQIKQGESITIRR